jgi:hypothetical protein
MTERLYHGNIPLLNGENLAKPIENSLLGGKEREQRKKIKNKKLKMYSGRITYTGRNRPKQPKRPKQAETGRNFGRGGTWGSLVPVCMLVRDFPSVPARTERNIQHWSYHEFN